MATSVGSTKFITVKSGTQVFVLDTVSSHHHLTLYIVWFFCSLEPGLTDLIPRATSPSLQPFFLRYLNLGSFHRQVALCWTQTKYGAPRGQQMLPGVLHGFWPQRPHSGHRISSRNRGDSVSTGHLNICFPEPVLWVISSFFPHSQAWTSRPHHQESSLIWFLVMNSVCELSRQP